MKVLRDGVQVLFSILEVSLVTRLILKLLGANPAAEAVAWVYNMTDPLLRPFTPAFPAPTVQGQFTLEFSTVFALFTYAFLGFLVGEALSYLSRRR